jgi:gliding motility-associated-like protein
MIQREKSRDTLLFLMALAPCLCWAQTSNEGIVSVKPGTILSTVSFFENKQGAQLINDGELYAYSDLVNDGKISFTSGVRSGITRLRGQKTGTLAVSGSGLSEVYNLEFNNSNPQSGFDITNALTVYGQADFQNGVVGYSASDGLLSFSKDAVALNANEESFVTGSVVKNGNNKNAFIYPVGDAGKFRPASIYSPNDIGSAFKVKYTFRNPNALYPVSSAESSIVLIDAAEYWEIKRTDTGNGNAFVTLRWDESTTPAAILADPLEDLHVVRWDDVKKLWIDEGGVVDASSKEVVTVSQSLGNYGVFTLARVTKNVNPDNGKKTIASTRPGISPNGDGLNDELVIHGLEAFPENRVTVFDRYGKVIFDTKAYNTNGNVFKGFVNQSGSEILPVGTYFYTVEYLDQSTGKRVTKSNYLYINL